LNYKQLYENILKKRSFLCIGLDTDYALLPEHLKNAKYPLFEFNKAVIDVTARYSVAYKPNLAFYEAEGAEGWKQLEMTVDYIRKKDSSLFIIADAKRGDIGNTAQKYATAFFEKMDFDAVTLSPYMGRDSIDPFLRYNDKWAIVLALTSNPSATDFETIITGEEPAEQSIKTPCANMVPLYRKVIESVSGWGSVDNTMFVVGATRPEKLAGIREFCPDHFLLVPGVGVQGGTIAEVARYGMNSRCGLLVNISRGITNAWREERELYPHGLNFEKAVATAVAAAAAETDLALTKL